MRRIGYIINSRVPDATAWQRGLRPHHWLLGWGDEGSPMHFMRFAWVAEEVNRAGELFYELYRPWRRYEAVVFLKSMGSHCERLVRRLRSEGSKVLFEANVDYYTEAPVENLPGELAPTAAQRAAAIFMTREADGVIASSRRLAEICAAWTVPGREVVAVPDNILPRLVPSSPLGCGWREGKLEVWWSGMAAKLYDFLLLRPVLQRLPVRLHWVTGDWQTAMRGWPPQRQQEFRELLSNVEHCFHPFRGIPQLLRLYRESGGVIISPRYLDSPYNHSHTEWKLTLGLACGLCGAGSPLPSYEDAAQVAGDSLQICRSLEEWQTFFAWACADPEALREIGELGAQAILRRYGTGTVAREHATAVQAVLSRGGR